MGQCGDNHGRAHRGPIGGSVVHVHPALHVTGNASRTPPQNEHRPPPDGGGRFRDSFATCASCDLGGPARAW